MPNESLLEELSYACNYVMGGYEMAPLGLNDLQIALISTSLISKVEVAYQREDGIVEWTPYQVEMEKILGRMAELRMVFAGLEECHAALAKLLQ